MKGKTESSEKTIPQDEETTERREFLARLGRYALYTAPIFLELSRPSTAAYASLGPIETQTIEEV